MLAVNEEFRAEVAKYDAYAKEQLWSGRLRKWTWIVQFMLMGPVNIVIMTQLGLLGLSAMQNTSAEGSPVIILYGILGLVSFLLLVPAAPFMQRVTNHVGVALCVIVLLTSIYNLKAFPFDQANPLKVYFYQSLDLESGRNRVHLRGLGGYLESMVADIPSARQADAGLQCHAINATSIHECSWDGPPPEIYDIVKEPAAAGNRSALPDGGGYELEMTGKEVDMGPGIGTEMELEKKMMAWSPSPVLPPNKLVELGIKRMGSSEPGGKVGLTFSIRGANTRSCRIYFDKGVAREIKVFRNRPDHPGSHAGPHPHEHQHPHHLPHYHTLQHHHQHQHQHLHRHQHQHPHEHPHQHPHRNERESSAEPRIGKLKAVAHGGAYELRLWARDWQYEDDGLGNMWEVEARLGAAETEGEEKSADQQRDLQTDSTPWRFNGRVSCMWNEQGWWLGAGESERLDGEHTGWDEKGGEGGLKKDHDVDDGNEPDNAAAATVEGDPGTTRNARGHDSGAYSAPQRRAQDYAAVAVPALTEIRRYIPRWAIVTKAKDGLVEGWRPWAIE